PGRGGRCGWRQRPLRRRHQPAGGSVGPDGGPSRAATVPGAGAGTPVPELFWRRRVDPGAPVRGGGARTQPTEIRSNPMRPLIVTAFVSLDGVMEAPGGGDHR